MPLGLLVKLLETLSGMPLWMLSGMFSGIRRLTPRLSPSWLLLMVNSSLVKAFWLVEFVGFIIS